MIMRLELRKHGHDVGIKVVENGAEGGWRAVVTAPPALIAPVQPVADEVGRKLAETSRLKPPRGYAAIKAMIVAEAGRAGISITPDDLFITPGIDRWGIGSVRSDELVHPKAPEIEDIGRRLAKEFDLVKTL